MDGKAEKRQKVINRKAKAGLVWDGKSWVKKGTNQGGKKSNDGRDSTNQSRK